MKAYVIRRLLLMIPTFFGISLVLFVILNVAPGRPGKAQSGDLAQDAKNEATQESSRIFREQFGLDKPVLFNTRFTTDFESVRDPLQIAAGVVESNAAGRIRAQEDLEDLGVFGVPHLMRLLDDPDPRMRDAAVHFLRLNALRPLERPFEPNPSPELRARNQAIDRENAELRELRYGFEEPDARKREVIAAWKRWYAAHPERFRWNLGDKIRIFFVETRFARYWSNLLRLDFGVSLVTREPVVRTLVSKLKYSL
jgi:peptide/nickel transport system permease protein